MSVFHQVYQQTIFDIVNHFQTITVEQIMEIMHPENSEKDSKIRFSLLQMIKSGLLKCSDDGMVIKLTDRTPIRDSLLDCIWVAMELACANDDDESVSMKDKFQCITAAAPFSRPLKIVYASPDNNSVYYIAAIKENRANEAHVLHEHLRNALNDYDGEGAAKVKVIIVTWDHETAKAIPPMPEFDVMTVVFSRPFGKELNYNVKPDIEVFKVLKASKSIKKEIEDNR